MAKNFEKNEVILAQGQDHPALYADGLIAAELNWLVDPPASEFRARAKVRYRQVEQDCLVTILDGKVKVLFDRPQRAMTPRQSIVFYQGETCLGGGIIAEISPNYHILGKGLPSHPASS